MKSLDPLRVNARKLYVGTLIGVVEWIWVIALTRLRILYLPRDHKKFMRTGVKGNRKPVERLRKTNLNIRRDLGM
jgi:hypothetical protein